MKLIKIIITSLLAVVLVIILIFVINSLYNSKELTLQKKIEYIGFRLFFMMNESKFNEIKSILKAQPDKYIYIEYDKPNKKIYIANSQNYKSAKMDLNKYFKNVNEYKAISEFFKKFNLDYLLLYDNTINMSFSLSTRVISFTDNSKSNLYVVLSNNWYYENFVGV